MKYQERYLTANTAFRNGSVLPLLLVWGTIFEKVSPNSYVVKED